MEIVEQLQVLAFRNPGDLVFCPETFPLIQPPAAFAGIARLADTDGVVGNVRAAAGSQTPGRPSAKASKVGTILGKLPVGPD